MAFNVGMYTNIDWQYTNIDWHVLYLSKEGSPAISINLCEVELTSLFPWAVSMLGIPVGFYVVISS